MRQNPHDSLAALVVDLARRPRLPRHMQELEKASGWSIRTLRGRCQQVGITTKMLLDFIWCLRIVCVKDVRWDPRAALMDYKRDPRTIDRLLETARLSLHARPTLRHFIYHQCFMTSAVLRDQIYAALRRRIENS